MHLIFDFDGTIIDSFSSVMDKFNILADEFNFKRITQPELSGLRNLNSKELIRYLKIPIYKIPSILHRARKQMSSELALLAPYHNIPQILKTLHSTHFSLGILTSNSEENVSEWLKMNDLIHLFNFIHSESSYFGKSRVIKKILKKYKLTKQHVFYIGDETRDVDAAKQCNIYSIAVTWGFNSEKILTKHQPDFIANYPEDLLKICKFKPEADA